MTMPTPDTQTCANFYANPLVQQLLGGALHPGGTALTHQLLSAMSLRSGGRMLDVAAGTGTTARLLAEAFGQTVVAVDASNEQCQRITQLASEHALPIEAVTAEAVALPLADASFDAVICECAVSTFADKSAPLREIARVLKTGQPFGMSDMILRGSLPQPLAAIAGPWSCLGDALSEPEYVTAVESIGFKLVEFTETPTALLETLRGLKRQLLAMGMGQLAGILPDAPELGFAELRNLLREAEQLVHNGAISYGWWIFLKN